MLQREIMLAATKAGHRLWRNNVGVFLGPGGNLIRCGLAVGAADLIGIRSDGFFLSIEVKGPRGKMTKAQGFWLEMIRNHHGIAAEVRSVEEALAAIRE